MDEQAQAARLPRAPDIVTPDERLWAALAHASVLLMFFGPLVPLIIWGTQRKKSNYASFQALQAMAYQGLAFWVWMLLVPVLLIVMVLAFIVIVATASAGDGFTQQPYVVLIMQLAIFGVVIGSMLLFMAFGIVGALACMSGRDFRYPFFGNKLARYADYNGPAGGEMSEEKQDHVVAAVSHSTAIVLLWGLVTPLVAWLTEHERSSYLRFQAMQASVYQALGALAYFAVFGVYMVSMFGLLGAAMTLDSTSGSAAPALLAAFMIPIFAIVCVVALAMPLYHLFAFLASVATLRGRDYRYPVLGNLVAGRLKTAETK